MPIITPGPDYFWYMRLSLDAMYFQAARDACGRAQRAVQGIDAAKRRVDRLRERVSDLNAKLADQEISASDHYDKVEPLAIQLDDSEHRVGSAHGAQIKYIGVVHILAAACLEAHINSRIDQRLVGVVRKKFEWLPLDTKWLIFPRLIGASGFDPGAEPYQGFSRLVGIRNALVHYKPVREPWAGVGSTPSFLAELGLTLDAADRSLKTVERMASALSVQLGEKDPPSWLRNTSSNFFDIESERRKGGTKRGT